jgi:polyvinyl alcohol dehydrogenase (cytochrome)
MRSAFQHWAGRFAGAAAGMRPRRSAAASVAALSIFAALALHCGGGDSPSARTASPTSDWPMYGHDFRHSFTAVQSPIDKTNVASLQLAWQVPIPDAVSATPSVVDGVVYVGGWDGVMYALDADTGSVKWTFEVDCQNSILPVPPRCLPPGEDEPDRSDTDGGLIVGTAAVDRGKVYFGGGRTLYCLDAATGTLVWKHVLCGNPDDPNCEADDNDPAQLFSSPVVANGLVVIGISVDGAVGYRGGIVAVDAASGKLKWRFEVDPIVDANGKVQGGLNRGCGDVWSTGAVDAANGLIYFGTADCQGAAPPPYHEAVLALEVATGRVVWTYRPRATDTCDFDFGASANLMDVQGMQLVGVGNKDGTYYALDRKTGALVWKTNVVFGGSSGGFIGSAAFDGTHIYAGTAFGELGGDLCMPDDPRDMIIEDPSFHAFDARTGAVEWEHDMAYTFAPTSVSAGAVFNGVGNGILSSELRVYDGDTGGQLVSFRTGGGVNSAAAIVGDTIYFGAGNSYDGRGGAVFAYRLP